MRWQGCLTEKRLEGSKTFTHADIPRESIPDTGNSTAKALHAGASLAY